MKPWMRYSLIAIGFLVTVCAGLALLGRCAHDNFIEGYKLGALEAEIKTAKDCAIVCPEIMRGEGRMGK